MYYFEIPQEVTNEKAITLVYYLAQQKTGYCKKRPCGFMAL